MGRLSSALPPVLFISCWLISVCLWAIPSVGTSAPIQTPISLGADQTHTRLLPSVSYYIDANNQDIGAILQRWKAGEFQPATGLNASIGLESSTVWVRFALKNNTANAKNLVLEYPERGFTDLELFLAKDWTSRRLGAVKASGQRSGQSLDHIRPAFSLYLPAQTTDVFYLRIYSDQLRPVFIDMQVWQTETFEHHRYNEIFFMGLIGGLLVMIMFMSLTAYISNKDLTFFYYATFIASSLYCWGAITGLSAELFFSHNLHWSHAIISGSINIALATQFTRHFLQTGVQTPRMDKMLLALIIFTPIPITFSLLNQLHYAFISAYIQISGMTLLMLTGLILSIKGDRRGFWITLAWGIYISSLLVYPIRDMGMVDHNTFTYWWGPGGLLVEILLLLFIFYQSFKQAETTQEASRRFYINALENQTLELELEVRSRTRQLEEQKEKAEQEARTDELTKLPNRRLFLERLQQELSRCQRRQKPLCLLMIDVDHFKRVNDQYGHDVGDETLSFFSQQISKGLRDYDLFARIGGEEFALLMPDTPLTEAKILAERLLEIINSNPMIHGENTLPLSFTGGLVLASATDTSSSILSNADHLLYQGKTTGRNKICSQ